MQLLSKDYNLFPTALHAASLMFFSRLKTELFVQLLATLHNAIRPKRYICLRIQETYKPSIHFSGYIVYTVAFIATYILV